MSLPQNLKYTKDHEWVRLEGTIAVVGITDHAQQQLGDVVFVELSAVGTQVSLGQTFGTVESVKAVSDLFVPLTGEVIETNTALPDSPELVNSDPYGKAWMIKIKLASPADVNSLLSAPAYEKLLAGG